MFFKRKNVFIECERFDAEITARDNALNEKEKEMNLCDKCGGIFTAKMFTGTFKGKEYHLYCLGVVQKRYFEILTKERQDANQLPTREGTCTLLPKK